MSDVQVLAVVDYLTFVLWDGYGDVYLHDVGSGIELHNIERCWNFLEAVFDKSEHIRPTDDNLWV